MQRQFSTSGVEQGRDLTIVIPAFNEQGAVAHTLRRLRATFPAAEIILVDDCSTDGTLAEASSVPEISIFRHRFNRGYGAALKTGMMQAKGEAIAWFDADGEHRPGDLRAMVDLFYRESVAAVLGRRPSTGQPKFRLVGKFLLRTWARSLGQQVDRDLNCGLRVFHAEAIRPYIPMLPDRFSASTTSTLIMLAKNFPIRFYDIETEPRVGQSKVRLRHGFETLLNILRATLIFGPLRLYGTVGLVLLALGMAYGLGVAFIADQGFPTFGLVLITSGLMLLALGLIADQISHWRLSMLETNPIESSKPKVSQNNTHERHPD
jgi:glycosyltransferase involved in cell wall biosynthesis